MQLSLALAYKSDSEDPSRISKCCSAVFLLFLEVGGVGKTGGGKFVICLSTASCSNQVSQSDFFSVLSTALGSRGGSQRSFLEFVRSLPLLVAVALCKNGRFLQ